jgi:hypothetical protein
VGAVSGAGAVAAGLGVTLAVAGGASRWTGFAVVTVLAGAETGAAAAGADAGAGVARSGAVRSRGWCRSPERAALAASAADHGVGCREALRPAIAATCAARVRDAGAR